MAHTYIHLRRPHFGRFGRGDQPSGYARSSIQITRFGASSGGRLGDRVADHNGGYLKPFAKSASDQGVCGGDMSLPDGTCETRNTKSGSEKRIDAGHVGNIVSGAAETPL